MQRCFLILVLIAMMSEPCAQELEPTATPSSETTQETGENYPAEAPEPSSNYPGVASINSTEAAQKSNWQNWVFAGSALITVTAGVVIISLNSGTTSH